MLVNFSVQNHRAIREKQTFWMLADEIDERLEPPYHVARTGFASVPFVLRDACIFGGNGSGKTSFIQAMAFMSNLVRISNQREAEDEIGIQPFIFHPKWKKSPSEFEINFIHKRTLYQYGLIATRNRILKEYLFNRPKPNGRWRNLFYREYIGGQKKYDWYVNPKHIKGERNSWRNNTRPNALFLSTAVQNNAKGDITRAYDWITKRFNMLSMKNNPGISYTINRFSDLAWKNKTLEFFREIDIDFSDIKVEEREVAGDDSEDKKKLVDIEFVRNDHFNSPTALPYVLESSGTRALFGLSGPILDTLEKGNTIVIDELNLGLHPVALQSLVAMFCDPKINTKNAQIVFTTHDASVVENTFSEVDQVWLFDKDGKSLAASLTSLAQYEDSDTKNFSRDYLAGRYGGVPNPWRRL